MSSKNEDSINLELMESESIISALPDTCKQTQTSGGYKNVLLLTTKRLVLISKASEEQDLTFVDIKDVEKITMESINSNKKTIARAALMAIGALCSIYIIQIIAIAIATAITLIVGAVCLIIDSRNKNQYGTLSVFTNHTSLVMPYEKGQYDNAVDFVNSCFNVKNATGISAQYPVDATKFTNQYPFVSDTGNSLDS